MTIPKAKTHQTEAAAEVQEAQLWGEGGSELAGHSMGPARAPVAWHHTGCEPALPQPPGWALGQPCPRLDALGLSTPQQGHGWVTRVRQGPPSW